MLAYCTALGLRRGYLVYADLDGTSPGTTTVRNADVEIVVTSIDLNGTIDELTASVKRLAEEMSAAQNRS
jgi:5-methylcytosine-specific restriction enzyme subunit McrC